jgi:hypothetical protein
VLNDSTGRAERRSDIDAGIAGCTQDVHIARVSLDKEDDHLTRLLSDLVDRTMAERMQENAL